MRKNGKYHQMSQNSHSKFRHTPVMQYQLGYIVIFSLMLPVHELFRQNRDLQHYVSQSQPKQTKPILRKSNSKSLAIKYPKTEAKQKMINMRHLSATILSLSQSYNMKSYHLQGFDEIQDGFLVYFADSHCGSYFVFTV